MATQFDNTEWGKINAELDANPDQYGLPKRVYGSVVIGSFNIRKLGYSGTRNENVWKFLGRACRQFDLLAVQEVLDDLSGLKRLMEEMGPDYGMIVSDKTGAYPGDRGVGERLAYIFRWAVVKRGEVVSDITYDRSKVAEILFENLDTVVAAKADYEAAMQRYTDGLRKTKPKLDLPIFLSFIRQPFCVSFKIVGFPGTKPYRFMAVNAHLIYGRMQDREKEFQALIEWIIERVKQDDKTYYPNFMLLGDLNLNYDRPELDMPKIEKYMKSFNNKTGDKVNVNFPFLDKHRDETEQYTSNVKLSQRYDQIGLFFREQGLPTYLDNKTMGTNETGPDYGVFNFTELFCKALNGKNFSELTKTQKSAFVARYEHKVSDHMPLWLRLPLPYK